MDHSQTVTNKVLDHIRYNRLPLKYTVNDDFIIIDCSGWDITEIDNLIMEIDGTREGFIVRIENGNSKIHN